MIGITGYGAAIPRARIRVEEIARVWGKNAEKTIKGLNVREKAVAAFDEDSCTLAVEAARIAVECAGIEGREVGAVFVGSESKPYAVNPTASTVAEAIEAVPYSTGADLEFACKAGTTGIQACVGMVSSGLIKYGLAIGSDTAQGAPGDVLEYTAASGAGAVLVGKENAVAEINASISFTTDTPDFWRRRIEEFPRHGGRFTGKPAYFKHVVGAANALFEKTGLEAKDFDYVVFHQPNGRFPLEAGKALGFEKEKILPGFTVTQIGNTYSASSLIGLAAVFDVAKPGEKIMLVSYGSGAGSDALAFTVTKEIEVKGRRPRRSVRDLIADKEYVDYATYIKHRRKLKSL